MAILDILHFPDPRLRNKAKPVAQVDDSIRRLIDDMLETMYQAPGIGLAATQVNVAKRVVVIDLSEEKNEPLCLVNPKIIEKDGEEQMEEGCLSVPGIYEMVKRANKIRVRALIATVLPLRWRPKSCWRSVFSTNWITWKVNCLWTIYPASSDNGSARSWKRRIDSKLPLAIMPTRPSEPSLESHLDQSSSVNAGLSETPFPKLSNLPFDIDQSRSTTYV